MSCHRLILHVKTQRQLCFSVSGNTADEAVAAYGLQQGRVLLPRTVLQQVALLIWECHPLLKHQHVQKWQGQMWHPHLPKISILMKTYQLFSLPPPYFCCSLGKKKKEDEALSTPLYFWDTPLTRSWACTQNSPDTRS